jgi:hypothetical protein
MFLNFLGKLMPRRSGKFQIMHVEECSPDWRIMSGIFVTGVA